MSLKLQIFINYNYILYKKLFISQSNDLRKLKKIHIPLISTRKNPDMRYVIGHVCRWKTYIKKNISHLNKKNCKTAEVKKNPGETPSKNPWTEGYVNCYLLLQKCLHPTAVIKVSCWRLNFRWHVSWTKHFWSALWQENDSPFIIFALVPHSIHPVFSLWCITRRLVYTSFSSLISDQITCSVVSAHVTNNSKRWILKTILMQIVGENDVTQ